MGIRDRIQHGDRVGYPGFREGLTYGDGYRTALLGLVMTGYRWRPRGSQGDWIYNPEPAWLEAHKSDVDWEPVYVFRETT